MGMSCTVCDHPQRIAIDQLASLGASSERRIAKQFGVTDSALHRHKAHIAARTSKAVEKAESKQDDEFLAFIREQMVAGLIAKSAGIAALESGKLDEATVFRGAPAYMQAGLAATRLLGEATGRLSQAAATTTLNVLCVSIPGPPTPQASSPNVIEATSEVIPPGDTEE